MHTAGGGGKTAATAAVVAESNASSVVALKVLFVLYDFLSDLGAQLLASLVHSHYAPFLT